SIRTRKKKGFSAPVKQWFGREDLVGLARAVRAEQPELARAWLHRDLERTVGRFEGSRAYKAWTFLSWVRKNA
ncbi:MAG TPA: hypothetical protein VM389_05990, partial [Phycisphaerae bacterium]|nr:hypothetical protein [Phycisphaerae bacterium]